MLHLYNDIEKVMSRIETKWQKQNYSTDLFPEIAWEETEGFDFSPLGEISNQMALFDLPGVRIQQKQSTFSDMYVQIFHNGRFMIEILNWWGGHVNVHDHDFSAVQFQLKGDALNASYDFKSGEHAGALRWGELHVRSAEIWKEGGRSLVYQGPDRPHSVFHIGEPTTSLLIRTTATARYGAQSNYFPGLAAHYYVATPIQRKKLTGLSLLSRKSPLEFTKSLTHFLETQSLSENFFMLLKLGPMLFKPEYLDIISSYASKGERESRLLENVAINNGIDFFKTRANEIENLTPAEKLAAFSVAASHNLLNYERTEIELQKNSDVTGLRSALQSFILKMPLEDQKTAVHHLQIFGMQELAHECI